MSNRNTREVKDEVIEEVKEEVVDKIEPEKVEEPKKRAAKKGTVKVC